MDSVLSVSSANSSPPSPTRAAFIPFMYKVPVPQQQRDDLVAALDMWRTKSQAQRAGGRSLLSKRVILSDAQMQKLADHSTDFLREAAVTPDLICKLVPWDLASQDDLEAVAAIIMDWRFDAQRAIGLTPRGGHRAKQQNTMPTPLRAAGTVLLGNGEGIVQPSFSPARMQRGRPRGQGRGRGAGQAPRVSDADFFATSGSVPPRMMAARSSSGSHAVPLLPPASHPPLPASHPPPPPASVPANLPYNPYMPYYPAAYPYPPAGLIHPQMYAMYSLPPRYYPPVPNTQGQNP
ncbi:hypothetical protein B0H14DRAFT_2852534 [Mycena olivaceomarginata]|nr:hypothetical protein B0H14DRAFT_2852534 [Mycena olivaceomarginata]